MKSVLQLFCWMVLLSAVPVRAQQPAPPMSDAAVGQLLGDYLDAWQTADGGARAARLQKVWAPSALHESPFARSVGMRAIDEEIVAFQKMFPGASVSFGPPLRTGNNVLVTFELRKADGSVAASGYDYIELDQQGRIAKVIGFVK